MTPNERLEMANAMVEAERLAMITHSRRSHLLASAKLDAKHAVECMERGDWLRGAGLLKLALDQLADAGLIP